MKSKKTRQRHHLTVASIDQNESCKRSTALTASQNNLHSLYHYPSFRLHTTQLINTLSFMKCWKSETHVEVGKAGWVKVGSPINVNYNTSSWSAMNLKYWLYSGRAELSLKGIDLAFGKLSLSTHCSAARHLASFLSLWFLHTVCEVLSSVCVCCISSYHLTCSKYREETAASLAKLIKELILPQKSMNSFKAYQVSCWTSQG